MVPEILQALAEAVPPETSLQVIFGIADVAWYVRPGSALDRDAQERGNSVYFPDRVVPMLPEQLSNDLCSLRPQEDRPVLAVHIWIDAQGRKRRHRFARAMIRSAARLTYEAVQNAIDGRRDPLPGGLPPQALEPLYAAFRALDAAREARGTIDLDIEERLDKCLVSDGRHYTSKNTVSFSPCTRISRR